ncbi:helicase-related protein [Pseudolabrys sp.]|uniref:helicase-related protein n=1 Tax=Pseudolabrys sp. TaxID=1960880 RepID=UPI003D136039
MSEFHRLLLGLHARARRIDRDQALLGALGVAALAYEHQIDNVHRMVTGTNCRWLLADEVGLGKTIQAIMVMRALAAQSPRLLNVALVVPDDLASQWAEELLARGHVLPLEAGQDGGISGNLVLRLARPSRLAAGGRLAAEKIDLLIIDEFTKLQVQVRRDLIVASRSVPHVLVVTATPALHLASMRQELMALIEPEADRMAQAEERDILAVLAERERRAIEHHSDRLKDAGGRRALEQAHGLYRRLIRTVRTDYPNALPKRHYQPIRLNPTDGDVERARTTRTYLDAAKASDVEIRRDLLLQVASRSPVSLRERLSTLRRSSPSLHASWQQIDICLREEPGDAKLDALIDHLRALHARNEKTRVVIVAEDNPTTDYLREAIEALADLKVANKRRVVSAAEELAVQVAGLKEALEDFITGEAKVLVAADVAKEGHNLQFANEIIFFALPWSPLDIQQWIGRIDRLGTKGIPANRHITITPIVTEGSIEDQILSVLEGTGVFLRSEVFDEAEWQDISNAINAAAEGIAGASWNDALRTAKALGETYDAWLDTASLKPMPRAEIAARRMSQFRDRHYAMPMAEVDGYSWNWYHMRERAADLMLRLAREDYLALRNGYMGEQRFRTMWYKSKPGPEDFTIPDLDTRNSWYHLAFITRRSAIECPPYTYVVQNNGDKRQLHFFDHGCSLHDHAVAAFERQMPATDIQTEFTVEYPSGHPILQWEGRRLLIGISEFDVRDVFAFDFETMIPPQTGRTSKAEQDAREAVSRSALVEFEADRRWLIDLAPPELLVAVLAEDRGHLAVAEQSAAALFDPSYEGAYARQIGKRRLMPSENLNAARAALDNRLQQLGRDGLNRTLTALRGAFESRLFAVQADIENLTAAAKAEITAAASLDAKLEFNRAIQRGAALRLELTERAAVLRLARLKRLQDAVKGTARISTAKVFWLLPRGVSASSP